MITKVNSVAKTLTKNYEIIVIDDGSTDRSRRLLMDYKKKFKKLRLIFHPKNRGYGGVLKTGFESARNDLIFYTDGDGQYDVGELAMLWSLMSDDVNFVNGIKIERNDYSYRVVLGNMYALFVRWAFYLPTYDVDCDFRLIKRSLIKKVKLTCNSGAVCVELVKKSQQVGARIRQVSVHHYPRKYGQSQFFRPKRLVHTAYELGLLWWKVALGYASI